MIFTYPQEQLSVQVQADKETYDPYELVNLEFTLTGKEKIPVQTPFALSVRDGMNEVESGHNMLTDLLLMSEIKGYVNNPQYYFESRDDTHRKAIDLLLRVQGWRRYSWKQMTGIESLDLKYGPEQGIETRGQVVSFVRQLPKPNVEVSCFLKKRGENEENSSFIEAITTDSLGHFSLISDIYGKWDLILAVTVNRKKKDYRILLDRLFSPAPRKYHYADMQVSIANAEKEKELMLLRKERLEAENKNLKYAETENELLLNRFLTSDIYYRFHMKEDWRPKENDWEELYKALDETYDGFTHRLMGVAKKLTSTELRVSCLVKSNVPPVTIAMLIVTTPTNVSMIRKRLYEKIHSQKGSSEKFDRFIQEF